MTLKTISFEDFTICAHQLWNDNWFLLTSGDYNAAKYNTMTVAWGSFGTMWNKPFAQVVVRPTRYTYQFMEKYSTFTLSAFGKRYRDALMLLGTKSGRDGDKIGESGLTIAASSKVSAPCFSEAELIIECKKIYFDDFEPKQFLEVDIFNKYPEKDYHRIYYGEILTVRGTDKYNKR